MGFTRFTANPDTRPHAGGGPRGGALPQAKGSVMEMGRDGAASPDLPQTDAISNTVGRKSFSLGLQPHPRENFASAVLADGGFIQRANSTFVPPTLFPPRLPHAAEAAAARVCLPDTGHLLAPWADLLECHTCRRWCFKPRGRIVQGIPTGVGSKHQEQLLPLVPRFVFCEGEWFCGVLRNAAHGEPEHTRRRFTS